ncbi:polyamine aminopropyltransferase [Thermodesulfobacteriota bacterium]
MSLSHKKWVTEVFEDETAFSALYSRKLLDRKSPYQRIEIYETAGMGRALLLNGCFMLTERDAFIYHEMLAHPALQVSGNARDILIIGGGDGGAVTEAAKMPSAEHITLCELDKLVVESCRELFPEISAGLNDPRVNLIIDDGAGFIDKFTDAFDVVLVDSTDPVGPAQALFEPGFYRAVKKSLRKGGIAVFQTESPMFMPTIFADAVNKLGSVFGNDGVRPYFTVVPCYPGGLWSFTFCSEDHDPILEAPRELNGGIGDSLSHYNPEVHRAAFAVPNFVRKLMKDQVDILTDTRAD